MRCEACSEPLTPGAKFCSACGSSIDLSSCRRCQTVLPGDVGYCAECGLKVDAIEHATDRDRPSILVAVLICEFVSPIDLEQELGTTQIKLFHRFFRDRCARVLDRYSGQITRFVGRRIHVEFRSQGRPDDELARVLEAGLTLRGEARVLTDHVRTLRPGLAGMDLEIRIAVHAERLPTSLTDAASAAESLDVIADVALRCLEFSSPGELVATQTLLDHVPGLFITSALEDLPAEPDCSVVTQASGVRSDRHAFANKRLTPFTSREVENALLADRWRRVSANEGRVVLIRGEAGIGKSRLISKFREHLDTTRYSWVECHCAPELRSSAFHPIATFFEKIIGLRRNDSPVVQLEVLENTLRDAEFPIDETIPLFASLLGIELSEEYPAIRIGKEERRQQTLDWLCKWVIRIADQQPTAVVFDDLHWSDPSTLELVHRLIDLVQNEKIQILLLLAARNEFDPDWQGVEQILLPRFSSAEVLEMADAVAGDRSLPRVLTHEVAALSEGIPLFIEEFTEAILESEQASPADEGSATIETTILRRISRISNRAVAHLISVVGQECSSDLLQQIAREYSAEDLEIEIEKLSSAGILERRRGTNGDLYKFSHALVRDALYETLSDEKRREYHERVAEALARPVSSSSQARPESIARHYELSYESSRAMAYYQRAAQAAIQISAHEEAILHLRAALSMLNPMEPRSSEADIDAELELLVTLGSCLLSKNGYGDAEVAEVFARAHELCDGVSDPELLFRATYGLSAYYQAHGLLTQSGDLSKQCLALAEQIGDPALRILSHQRIGLTRLYAGTPDDALAHFGEVLEIYDPNLHRPLAFVYGGDAGVVSRAYSAVAYFLIGRPDRARQSARAALADAREGGHQHTIAFALGFCGIVFHMLGDDPRILEISQEAIRESERFGFALWSRISHVLHGTARSRAEITRHGASDEIRQALRGLDEIGSVVGTPMFYEMYAKALIASGAEQAALEALETSLQFAESTESNFWTAEVLRVRGELLARRGQTRDARSAFESAVEIARTQGSRSLELHAASSLERLLRREGREKEADAHIESAWEHFAAGFDTLNLDTLRDVLRLTRAGLESHLEEEEALENLIGRLPKDATHMASLRLILREPSPRYDSRVADRPSKLSDLVASLTPRRLEVLRLVAKGLTNREVANVLAISEHTAKAHVAGLLEALDLTNRTEAAVALREFESE